MMSKGMMSKGKEAVFVLLLFKWLGEALSVKPLPA